MSKRTALLIHNSNFKDPFIDRLPKRQADVESLAQVLRHPDVGDFDVRVLTDQKFQDLREELARLFRAQEPGDIVFVAYFGHALQDRFGEMYLAATDTSLEVLDATGLRIGFLGDQLDRSRSEHKVVLLDCPLTAAFEGAREVIGSSSGLLDALEGNGQGRALLTASDRVEAALDGGEIYGQPAQKLFTQRLADGFASGAADLDGDGHITFGELYEFIYRHFSAEGGDAPTPRKFSSSDAEDILIGRNPVQEPTELPPELVQALESPHDWMREGAISELERLLEDEDRSRAHVAHQALVSLTDDSTPSISQSATAVLQRHADPRKEEPRPSVAEAPRQGALALWGIPVWGWILGGFMFLFAIGFLAGLAGLIGGLPSIPQAGDDPTATDAPAVAAASPTPTEEPVVTPAATEVESAAPLPSSLDMAFVPGGTYPIGANQAAELQDYWIDQFEVTNREYADFASETGAPLPEYWLEQNIPEQMGSHPVRAVPWDMAEAYCQWVDKRLPTEAEWEVAARGPDGHPYPWGSEASDVELPPAGTYPVGSIPSNRSFFGNFDLAGNVWEWVDAPYLPIPESDRVMRGGANNFQNDMLERLIGDPNASATITDAGFRCAADEAQTVSDPSLALSDGFADIRSGWFQARQPVEDYFYGYHPTDFYHVQVSAPDDCLAVRHALGLPDFIAEVEIFQAATDTETANYRHGVMIRESRGDFYAFLISPRTDGWRVIKNSLSGIAIMDEGTDTGIQGQTRDVRDRLAVIANGPEFTFFINGELVSRVYDDEYADGNIGFLVQTLEETYAHIHFDRIRVWELPTNATTPTIPPGTDTEYQVAEPPCSGAVTGDDLLESFTTYTVQEGETLSGIANQLGLSVADLKGANGRRIEDPNVITAGQVLIIPER